MYIVIYLVSSAYFHWLLGSHMISNINLFRANSLRARNNAKCMTSKAKSELLPAEGGTNVHGNI